MENVRVQKHTYRFPPSAFSAKQPPVSENDSTELNPMQIKELQQKLGKLHWYFGICCEIVPKVSKIASEQSRPTFKQLNDINHIIAYLAERKNTALFFKPSNMQLLHGIRRIFCVRIEKQVTHWRNFPYRRIRQGKSTYQFPNRSVQQVMERKPKHIDRRYYSTRHEVKKGTFKIVWYKGSSNLADFFTKLMSPAEHERFNYAFTVQFTIGEDVTAHNFPIQTSGLKGR